MKSHLVIAIQDSNRFFALGIQLILQGHFFAKGQTVSFVSMLQGEPRDLIIQAERPGWPLLTHCIQGGDGQEQPRTLVILEVCPLHYHPCQRGQGVINRHERPNAVCQLIENMFETPLSPAPQCTRCSVALTPREQEVLQAIAAELPSHQIARKLTIHLKTVSAHKTAAMRKLGFRRNSELYHWLRNGGLEFKKGVLS